MLGVPSKHEALSSNPSTIKIKKLKIALSHSKYRVRKYTIIEG
jgi:hypothetical protein